MDIVIEPLFPGCPWSQFRPPTIQYCEQNLCSLITQPANAWSNIFYFVVGSYLVYENRFDKNKILQYLGPITILVGLASFLYHASFTFMMQFFDLSSMFLFSGFLLTLNIYRWKRISEILIVPIFFGIVATSMFLLFLYKSFGIPIFALQCLIIIGLEISLAKRQEQTDYKNLYITLGFLFSGLLFWILDFFGFWCQRNNHLVQGHAIWHVLSSFCFLYLYRFYMQFFIEMKR